MTVDIESYDNHRWSLLLLIIICIFIISKPISIQFLIQDVSKLIVSQMFFCDLCDFAFQQVHWWNYYLNVRRKRFLVFRKSLFESLHQTDGPLSILFTRNAYDSKRNESIKSNLSTLKALTDSDMAKDEEPRRKWWANQRRITHKIQYIIEYTCVLCNVYWPFR